MNAKSKLQGKIQYKFQNEALLESALIHPSTPGSRTADLAAGGFERLEFLGDRVLGLAIASLLLDIFPNAPEGELSKRHTALVRKEALVRKCVCATERNCNSRWRRSIDWCNLS